jgi:hypothetical protein
MKRKQLFSLCWAAAVVLVLGHTAIAGPPGLVAYWTFDEGQGQTAFDSSGNGLDGTLNGNPKWVDGQLGGALDFDGSDDFVEIPDDPLLALTKEITLAAWTNMRATASGEMAIVSKGGWAANDLPYELTETPGDVIFWQFYNDAGRDSCSPNSPPVSEWHHIVATYDGKIFKCYIDGELAEEWAYAGTMPKNTASVNIGRRSRGGTYFNGMIDDVAIYDRALDQEEIQSVMEGHLKEDPLAQSPNPRNGAMINQTWATLKWRAGTFAVAHEVYFGESFEKVSAATPADTDVFVGRQSAAELSVGTAGGPYPGGLVPGKTYYWRVDEINESKPDSPWKGTVWSFQVQPLTAWKPYPADGMKYVDPEQDLSWEKGMGVLFHLIYFGESFDQVNSIPAGGWMSVTAAYDPGTLQLDKTYYWRVDEFAGALTHKGPVWSFTTRGSSGGVKAQYFKGMELAGEPVLTQTEGSIDHLWASAEIAAGLADNVSARWTANLQVPFTESYRLITTSDDGVRLWLDGRLVIDNWTDHGTTDNTATANLVAGQNYAIRMEYYENTGDAVAQLSWESSSLPRQIIPQGWLQLPLWATSPSPAHNATNTQQELTLQWLAGDEATHQDVYFGDNAEAVANADSSTTGIYQGRQAVEEVTFDPGPLDWNKTYYWRVDEINTANAASPWKGSVWSFTTADFIVVEDFESYTDEEGSEIFMTWIDGWADSSSGSRVGYLIPPYAEQKIFHGGRQSMPLDYNNVASPYYSEAQRTWDTPQNWTLKGADTLVLFIRGNARNQAAPLYVVVEDTAGHSGTATQTDTAVVTATTWTEWKIPLSSFTAAGVKANSIEKLTIGVGSRTSPAPGPAGLLYIDDIRVTKP